MITTEFKKVNVCFDKVSVLRDINLKLEEGKIYSLIGPNGAGKSTLMETCMSVHSYEGDIILDGKSIKSTPTHDIEISYVPQENNIYRRLTVHDNIQLARTIRKSRLDIEEVYEIFPILRERRNQIAHTLSGGEARQLAIALALVSLKSFVMLDEPLTGLSPRMAKETLLFIERIRKEYDVTVLISEQNLEVADISDYICVLRSGGIVAELTRDEWLMLSKEEITEMVFGRACS
jgi:branched-chain amino acid transport system ATP-binding protein